MLIDRDHDKQQMKYIIEPTSKSTTTTIYQPITTTTTIYQQIPEYTLYNMNTLIYFFYSDYYY